MRLLAPDSLHEFICILGAVPLDSLVCTLRLGHATDPLLVRRGLDSRELDPLRALVFMRLEAAAK